MMNNDIYPDFDVVVEKFFNNYLAAESAVSHHTILSYKNAFLLLLDFYKSQLGIGPDKISLMTFDKELILRFLDWLENTKGNAVSTRNQRCNAMRTFARYLAYSDPSHLHQWNNIGAIKLKKCGKDEMSYLTIEGMKVLFEQIDTTTAKGRRDLALLSLLYNSGARVQELIDITPRSLRLDNPCIIKLHGKGSKTRIVPLDESMSGILSNYMKEYGIQDTHNLDHPLFFNSHRQKLTRPGITYLIHKYADRARDVHPDKIPQKLSPHSFRHSKAMHLLQCGVPLIYIRDILGHVSISTTEVYARADPENKRKALEDAYKKVGLPNPENIKGKWENDPKLKAFLRSL